MKVIDVVWAKPVNVLEVRCDCGNRFFHPSNYSAAQCPMCGRMELWHRIDPKPQAGIWSLPQMSVELEP